MRKSKIFMMVSIIILLISLVSSIGTYAWFTWRSTNNTSLTLRVGTIADITFDKGNDINTNKLAPVFNYNDGEVTTFSINNKDNTGANVYYTVSLKIDNIDNELSNESLKYKLISNGEEVGSGSFLSVYSGDTIKIGTGKLNSGITDFTFYLYIDGNIENNPNMMNKNIKGTLKVDAGEILSEHITNLYNNTSKTVVTNNNIDYNYATSSNLMNDRLGGTTSSLDGGNIRYYGATPNNYVYFNCTEYPNTNCELWRLIGVFDGKVKLVRNDSIGKYSYDNKPSVSGEPSEVESSDWRYARLMKLINPNYENEEIGGSLYYNSKSGTCYSGQNSQTIDCDFTSIGIKESTKEYISKEIWYLGGHSSGNGEFYPNYTNQLYQNEINDSNITWEGYVALINASDYTYARDLSLCLGTITTGNNNIDCLNNNYFQKNMQDSFLLNKYVNYSTTLARITYLGLTIGSNIHGRVYQNYDVYPSLYLNQNILVSSGDGSLANPFGITIY